MEKRANPIPQGNYVPATRSGNLIFTAGMTSRRNGVLIFTGRVKAGEPLEPYREAVCQAADNALTAALNQLHEGEHISQVLSLMVYVNAEDGFTLHSKLADFATDYLCERLGDAGVAARAALGVASLPGNAPVEIQIICAAS
ncbi:MAG: RidA family protein [Lawsonibacter sp.]|nr:RidA family protein [Lawsonibacter sp.]